VNDVHGIGVKSFMHDRADVIGRIQLHRAFAQLCIDRLLKFLARGTATDQTPPTSPGVAAGTGTRWPA